MKNKQKGEVPKRVVVRRGEIFVEEILYFVQSDGA